MGGRSFFLFFLPCFVISFIIIIFVDAIAHANSLRSNYFMQAPFHSKYLDKERTLLIIIMLLLNLFILIC